MTTAHTLPAPRAALMRDANFRWLVAGGAISMLGDQFTLIALPWLVLRMTGDTVVLGIVLALISVPRAVLILVGGAIVDRYSPRQVLMVTKHASTVLLGVLAVGAWTGSLTLPAIYALSLGIGLATAFSIPSGMSILPRSLPPAQLPAANGITMGMRQLSMFIGPLAAGVLVAIGGSGQHGLEDARGIAIGFGIDAFSFALSAWTLSRVKTRDGAPPQQGAGPSVGRSILDVLAHVRKDAQLLTCYLYWAAVAVLVLGPLQIALPVMASQRPELGASALGLMAGAHGAGTLVGMVVAGARPGLRIGTLGSTLLVFDLLIGALFLPFGHVETAWQGAGLMTAVGVLGGSMQVAIFTWLQSRVPPAMIGRAMSLFMFIFMGLVPMSAAVTGWAMRSVSVSQLFTACGSMLMLVAVAAAVASPMRGIRDVRHAA